MNKTEIKKGESKVRVDNLNTDSAPKIKYRPIPAAYSTERQMQGPLRELSTTPSGFKFDIGEAEARDAQIQQKNISILNQLQEQHQNKSPSARLPKKLMDQRKKQANTNKDIEAFISTPVKKTPVKSQTKA